VTRPYYYVCDGCGHLETREPVPENGEWNCPECDGSAAWEFPPEKGADAHIHAAHIERGAKSRLFVSGFASERRP